MLRTNVYLTEQQEKAINTRAAISKKSKAQILREVIDEGLKTAPIQKSQSAKVLLELAKIAEEFKDRGTAPKDLSANLDKYTWDE